jgi:lysophospholipase L1-like esterase
MSHELIRRLGCAAGAALLSLSIVAVPARADDKPANTKTTDAPKADAPKTGDKPAAATGDKPKTQPAKPKPPADQPSIKGNPDDPKNGFLGRHEGFLKDLKAKEGKVDLLLVGDSITDGWRGAGKEPLEKAWGSKMSVYNIGIGGDQTQHVIWRLDHGEVEGISPKVAMVMIGTNNLGGYPNEEIVAGITKIVHQLNEKLPHTKVLLLGVFPRGRQATDPNRARIKAINEQIAKLDDGGKKVKYLDIAPAFLAPDGTIPMDAMPDKGALHPGAKGYQMWVDAVQPTLDELMK